ncbi:MAG: transporter [Cohnella sp.]|nr:transporter [Cohnella sp.]
MDPILSFHGLTKKMPGDNKILFTNVSGEVFPNDRIAVLGASGQGKSTLLRILARLTTAEDGQLFWRGTPSGELPGRQWRTKVGYVSQQAEMLPGTIEDNLQSVSRLHKIGFDSSSAKEWMDEIGLGHLDWQLSARELSGGEKQRLALVRSLLLKPEVLLLDEATAALDETNKRAAERLLDDWQQNRQAALIWVTHDLEQAHRVASRIWSMEDHTLSENFQLGAVH